MATARWVTKRSYLQVSGTEILPVIFKSQVCSTPVEKTEESIPPAFPTTEVQLADSLGVVKEWLLDRIERMHRRGSMNLKRGALETPDVLRSGQFMFTVWFEPTAASFAILFPKNDVSSRSDQEAQEPNSKGPEGEENFGGFLPTPQTLQVVGEIVPCADADQ